MKKLEEKRIKITISLPSGVAPGSLTGSNQYHYCFKWPLHFIQIFLVMSQNRHCNYSLSFEVKFLSRRINNFRSSNLAKVPAPGGPKKYLGGPLTQYLP